MKNNYIDMCTVLLLSLTILLNTLHWEELSVIGKLSIPVSVVIYSIWLITDVYKDSE